MSTGMMMMGLGITYLYASIHDISGTLIRPFLFFTNTRSMPSGPLSGIVKAVIRRSQRVTRFFRLHAATPPRSPMSRSPSSSLTRHSSDNTNTFKDRFIGGQYFCFCMSTRYGVMIESILTILIASIIAAMVWFEVDSTYQDKVSHFP